MGAIGGHQVSARREFWLDLSERAAKTAAQAAAGVLAGTTVLSIDWRQAALIVGTAVLASVLTSLGSAQIGDADTASVIRRPPSLGDVGRTLGIEVQPDVGALPSFAELIAAIPPTGIRGVDDLLDATQQTPNVVRHVQETSTDGWHRTFGGSR